MTFIKGQSGNPQGRPAGDESVAAQFRSNPKVKNILKQVLVIAETLGTPDQHVHAWVAAKLVIDKTIPSLKLQEYEHSDIAAAMAELFERIDREAMEAYEKGKKSMEELEEYKRKNQKQQDQGR